MGFSPLDRELALLPGQLTPLLQDQLAHLGSWMPFAHAATMLARFTQVQVSPSTAQRQTESIGLAYEAVQSAEVDQIERDWPDVAVGPTQVVLSADGAMVPLVGGVWAEVKTLVVGEVSTPPSQQDQLASTTERLSYFSRMTDAATFQRLTLAELQHRRVETATQVAVVSDGAEWIQGLVDFHCPQATRILDFPHAAQRICQIGETVLGSDHASLRAWQTRQLHALKHHGPATVLATLQTFAADHVTIPLVAENLAYLAKRVAQIQYPRFQAQGWPIGSGIVESANKLVVEARLKGAGMHWSRASVNPLLALRNAVCNDRWADAWQQSAAYIRHAGITRRLVQSKAAPTPVSPPLPTPIPVAATPVEPATPHKPAANHPWRRTYQATKARMAQAEHQAKL